jgi:hypothetical protein
MRCCIGIDALALTGEAFQKRRIVGVFWRNGAPPRLELATVIGSARIRTSVGNHLVVNEKEIYETYLIAVS